MNRLNHFLVGCECNRPTLDTIRDAGFIVTEVEHTTMPKAPSFVRPFIVGSATSTKAAAVHQPQAPIPG